MDENKYEVSERDEAGADSDNMEEADVLTDAPVANEADEENVLPQSDEAEKSRYLIGDIIAREELSEGSDIDHDEVNNAAEDANERREARLEIYDWVQCVISTLIVVIIAFIFIGRQIGVVGSSMRDTLYQDDSVFITNLFYTPQYGDIIILKVESFSDTPLVKRVIATEGQTIDIDFDTSEVIVDGVVLEETYIREPTVSRQDFGGPVTVPEGCVFVMGDNRNASTDSRTETIGFVDVRNILGKVRFILMPGKDSYGSRDWGRLGSVYRNIDL